MSRRGVVLVGGPDAGKTNYVARLWHALKERRGAIHALTIPSNIAYVEEMIAHLFEGRFAPRSDLGSGRRDFAIELATDADITELVIPDCSGELWLEAVRSCEIDAGWMDELQRSDGAALFVRVHSDSHVDPLDWIVSGDLMIGLGDDERRDEMPTQVSLCELVRFLEASLADRPDGSSPRLAVVVSAYDLLDPEASGRGPEAYITRQYPMLAGRLRDSELLDVRFFGLSAVGGDLMADETYRSTFLEREFCDSGWVVVREQGDVWARRPDVTLPIAWLVGE